MPTRLSIAKPDIVKTFRESGRTIYTRSDIDQILNANRQFWRLAGATRVHQFIKFLTTSTELQEERIDFPYRPAVRYTWGPADSLAIVQSVNTKGYFSHYSAVQLHGLTEQLPKAIYFNLEQPGRGGGDGTLRQQAINNAFRGKCRTTTNVATFRGHTVHLLNGKNTGEAGVIDLVTSGGQKLKVTNIERTLIDATVRPVYSGGVFEVAKAFSTAHDSLSVNRLAALLQHIKFTYPYHQAIGFYLERAGLFKESQLDLMRQFPIEVDFYLDYGLKNPDYNKDWRLFIPKGF